MNNLKEKTKKFLEDNQNKLLVLLIVFASLIRLYYFFKVGEQPIWWDEGDYLALAKGLLLHWQGQEWWTHFSGIRPMLMPIIWYLFMLINSSELTTRFFTLLIPSIISVYLVYAIGRDLYDKKVGLISGLMLSVYWVEMFYTFRLLTDIPSMFLGLLSIYFFWCRYIKKNENKGLYYAIFFGVLGFTVRFPLALVPISYPIYLFAVKRFKLIKDKIFWKSMGIGFGSLALYFIITSFFGSNIFNAFSMYFGPTAVSLKTPISSAVLNILSMIPSFFEWVWFIAFIIGIITFLDLVLGFDLFLKQKEEKLNSEFFVILWIIITLFFYIVIMRTANDRWLLILMPPLFFISAKGILLVYDQVKKYSKEIAVLALILLLFGGTYQQIKHTHLLINIKKDSYNEEKLAGLWIKENFVGKNPKIVTASVVQLAYYSDGYTYGFYNEDRPKECFDLLGNLNTSQYCQNITEDQFNSRVKEIKPDFLIIHVFEPVFTPQWAYTYPERHPELLEPVQAYFADQEQKQPLLIIYKFKK